MPEPKVGDTDRCLNCHKDIFFGRFVDRGRWEPDYDPAEDLNTWRHVSSSYAGCTGFGSFAAPGWPEVVTLCGSTKFRNAFFETQKRLTIDERKIVISVGTFGHLEGLEIENPDGTPTGLKIALDELHKRKIDLSDSIFVINVGDYVGQSTQSEIDYAVAHGKPVRYLECHPHSWGPWEFAQQSNEVRRCGVCGKRQYD